MSHFLSLQVPGCTVERAVKMQLINANKYKTRASDKVHNKSDWCSLAFNFVVVSTVLQQLQRPRYLHVCAIHVTEFLSRRNESCYTC